MIQFSGLLGLLSFSYIERSVQLSLEFCQWPRVPIGKVFAPFPRDVPDRPFPSHVRVRKD